jgi:para-nitrobenzyl esterase
MVWLHGGAYTFGASSQRTYDATSLVSRGDVVVVTLNYRLAAFGFLDLSGLLPDGGFDRNLALKDVLVALRWVQENIAAFGGDPHRVTVFGESAGGGLVTTLLATPRPRVCSTGRSRSPPASSIYGIDRARDVAERFVRARHRPDGCRLPAALRAASADELVTAGMAVYAQVPDEAPGTLAFAPIIDGDLLPEAPATVLHEGRGLPVPLMIGTNKDEASLFKFAKSPLMPITEERISDDVLRHGHRQPDRRAAVGRPGADGVRERAQERRGPGRRPRHRLPHAHRVDRRGHAATAPVWLYRFDHAAPFLRLIGLGATHGSELAYLWGVFASGPRTSRSASAASVPARRSLPVCRSDGPPSLMGARLTRRASPEPRTGPPMILPTPVRRW